MQTPGALTEPPADAAEREGDEQLRLLLLTILDQLTAYNALVTSHATLREHINVLHRIHQKDVEAHDRLDD